MLPAGTKLDNYKILRKLGEGGMADVYEAEDENLGRRVALKVLPPELVRNQVNVQRFEKEVRAVAALDHSGIVTVFEVGNAAGVHYYSMRLLAGGDLCGRIAQKLTDMQALSILREVTEAFVHAHAHGFVHRDVKPANILFDEQGRAVLTDFGIAKAMSASTKMTATGVAMGTPRYISPEQARGKSVDARADLYSLGCILFEMLSSHAPYDAEDPLTLVLKHITEPIPRLPDELARYQPLVDSLMAKEPAQRPANAIELLRRIDELMPMQRTAMLVLSQLRSGSAPVVSISTPPASISAEREPAPRIPSEEQQAIEARQKAEQEEAVQRVAAEAAARETERRERELNAERLARTEQARKDAETAARAAAELERTRREEEQRREQEAERIREEEKARQKADEERRQQAEQQQRDEEKRLGAEQAAARQAEQAAARQAEKARQQAEDAAEQKRREEEKRIKAEQAAVRKAEKDRAERETAAAKQAEKARQQAEAAAEQERHEEEKRIKAEQAAVRKAEKDRTEREAAAAKQAEKAQQQAEAAAEKQRREEQKALKAEEERRAKEEKQRLAAEQRETRAREELARSAAVALRLEHERTASQPPDSADATQSEVRGAAGRPAWQIPAAVGGLAAMALAAAALWTRPEAPGLPVAAPENRSQQAALPAPSTTPPTTDPAPVVVEPAPAPNSSPASLALPDPAAQTPIPSASPPVAATALAPAAAPPEATPKGAPVAVKPTTPPGPSQASPAPSAPAPQTPVAITSPPVATSKPAPAAAPKPAPKPVPKLAPVTPRPKPPPITATPPAAAPVPSSPSTKLPAKPARPGARTTREQAIQNMLSEGRRALQRGQYQSAIEYADSLLFFDPGNAAALRLLNDAKLARAAAPQQKQPPKNR